MKKLKWSALVLLSTVFIFGGCATWNKTQKGAAVGTAAGGATGAVIGRAAGNTALGAIIGAAVGGASGAVIGRQMDKQAEEIKSKVPDAKVERVGEGIVVEFSSNVLFGFDEADLSAEAKANLNKLVTVLNTYPETDIEIQGHTDSKGSESYNQKLSKKRADKVSDYLANQGIANNRLNIQGFGETMPKYSNDDNEGRMRNRRVEFLITANETMKVHAEKVSSN
ncbi:MAG: OmpA family protein [Bacteroidales bacterium]|nr:OmpA family protein [Bacteroidales bacterium]